jgi:hypothetical protein
MKNIYNYIILPPEELNMSLDMPMHKERAWFKSLVDCIFKLKDKNETCLIKFKYNAQRKIFSEFSNDNECNFLNYCDQNTIIIGQPGSACIEALIGDLSYFPYSLSCNNYNKAVFNKLSDVLYIANNAEDIVKNLARKRIYRPGFSKKDLLHNEGMYLNQIIESILKK